MLLRCTQKFLTELRLKKSEVAESFTDSHPLDEWYAHIFYLYPRRKCAVFMHARTKFCFWAYDKSRDELNDIKGLFRKGLGRALFDEHYPAPVIKLFNDRLENIQIGLAKDRKVLGFINQRVLDYKFIADDDQGDARIHDEMLAGLESRRNPMVAGSKCFYAVDQMRDLLMECPELKGVSLPPADHRHDILEQFYKGLLAERSGFTPVER